MAGVTSFTDLRCWSSARDLSQRIFRCTQRRLFADDRRLSDQINDSSESVMANIAEGFGRGTQAQFVSFLGYSIGSLDETRSHLCAAYDRKYLTPDEFSGLWDLATSVRKLTVSLIRSMVQPDGGVKNFRKPKNWTDEVWEVYERVTGNKRPATFEASRPANSPSPIYHDDPPQKDAE